MNIMDNGCSEAQSTRGGVRGETTGESDVEGEGSEEKEEESAQENVSHCQLFSRSTCACTPNT